ncbi:hypothetical protein ZIOFF_039640 [Zingiber officinale]|uniref:Disease resistance RPP13-like protein 1 n=1 Tax=Zingiber officinale TaxID=94328 RepID=A0A8J5G3M2_ZINOF|nr:hypothetical protein ZIOFF_039640 [Zingiber officinale]
MAGGGGVFLSSMFTTMVAKLHGLASPSASSSSSSPHNNIEQEMSKLTETMRRIQAKLADSESEEENHAKSHSEKLWLSELKDVAYDAEDVVEEYEYEVLRSKQLHENNSGAHEDELANKAAVIRKRFDEITKEWKLLKLPKKAGKRKRSPMLSDMNRETGSLVVESDVLGREEEKDVLVKWLLSEDDTTGNGVSVIAVIGMGGLGKTTLAQLVYNDQRVKSYFDLTGWVCVSENFHVVSLTEKILQSFTKVKVHEELDELQRCTTRETAGEKVLTGKVIVTTRNHSVARIMQTTRDSLNLNVLPFDVCWSLFKKVTLEGADRSLRPDLEDIGRRIVEKCKGLPHGCQVDRGWPDWYDDAFKCSKKYQKAEWQLEYLEPHVNLKTLKITEYRGVKFVGWVGASSFTKLTKLVLKDCKNCSKLPPFGQFPSLEELEIDGMDGVQHVGREFCSMLIPSPSSQVELNIWQMDGVQHVRSGISSMLEPFPSLQNCISLSKTLAI